MTTSSKEYRLEVTFKGFKTRDEVTEFMEWYSNQGEQNVDIWMDARKDEGKDIQSLFLTESVDYKNSTVTLR